MASDIQAATYWYSATELAGLPGLPNTHSGLVRFARRQAWATRARAGRGGGCEYPFTALPPQAQAALLLRERRQSPADPVVASQHSWTDVRRKAVWCRHAQATDAHRAIAAERHRALLAVETLVQSGMPLMQARTTLVEQMRRLGTRSTSIASLGRWAAAVDGTPRDCWLPLLLPRWQGRTAQADIPSEAWDLYRADYLRLQAPSASACYERLQRIATARSWVLPSLKTFQRRIEDIPLQVRVLARQGEESLMRMYPAQERDRSTFSALEAINADGHRFDVFVRFPNGEVGRPLMVAIQDIYSGKMLAHRYGDSESSDLVRLAFADLVRDYGIPTHAWLDNGRSFAAKMLTGGARTRYRFRVRDEDPTGILVGLGITIHWATPYHGQAKPIERAFRDLCETVAKHPAFAGAYTGNSPTAKPEDYGTRAIAWDEFMRVCDAEIAAHNARSGRRTKVCAGRSFDATFAESYAASPIRKATPEQQRALFLAAESVAASRTDGSVHLLGNRYWTEALTAYAGLRVIVRFDPQHLHQAVAVYDVSGVYVGDADYMVGVGFADQAASREHSRAKSQWRRAAKQQLAAERRMAASEVAAQMPAPTPPELPQARVVQGVFRATGESRPMQATPEVQGPSALDRMMLAQIRRMKAESI